MCSQRQVESTGTAKSVMIGRLPPTLCNDHLACSTDVMVYEMYTFDRAVVVARAPPPLLLSCLLATDHATLVRHWLLLTEQLIAASSCPSLLCFVALVFVALPGNQTTDLLFVIVRWWTLPRAPSCSRRWPLWRVLSASLDFILNEHNET